MAPLFQKLISYTELTENLSSYNGHPTDRRCTCNENCTCTCQTIDPETCGLHSLVCSWSMYFNQLSLTQKLEDNLQSLATKLAPIYKQYAPVAYQNQVEYENVAQECWQGQKRAKKDKKAKKGQKRLSLLWVNTCLNFCAHPHRDIHNMNDGSKVVCILTQRDKGSLGIIPQDEQLHVLPLYNLPDTDEFSSKKGMETRIKCGAIEVLAPHYKIQKQKRVSLSLFPILFLHIRSVEKKPIPQIKQKINSTANSKALPLSTLGSKGETMKPEGNSKTDPHFT
ncbi:Methylcytosine dioxygenase TET1 [Plecturocebus cupreus]